MYQAEKMIKDNAEKIPADKKAEIELKIKDVQAAVGSNDIAGMQKGVEELRSVLSAVGASMYAEAPPQADPNGDAAAAPPPNDDDVVDGEYTDKKA